MTVGLADVSSRLQFGSESEAEKYIRDMVCEQVIHSVHAYIRTIRVSSKFWAWSGS